MINKGRIQQAVDTVAVLIGRHVLVTRVELLVLTVQDIHHPTDLHGEFLHYAKNAESAHLGKDMKELLLFLGSLLFFCISSR